MAPSGTSTKKYPTPDSDVDSKKMSARKRRASEMGGRRKKKAIQPLEATHGINARCPAHPHPAPTGVDTNDEDVFYGSDTPQFAPSLPTIPYSVTPGKAWDNMQVYKRAAFPIPGVSDKETPKYSIGDIVYINRHVPIPEPPPDDASPEERLQFERENYWVGLISEIRAENSESVYIRVFWLYWPEELPMGRQEYHGDRELVLSNHVDIVEAQCIAYHADVSFWDETDDSNQTLLKDKYWRQTLDLTKTTKDPRNALSKLRKFCICGGYDTPGVELYQCRRANCGTWSHHKCLIQLLEERAWEKFKQGVLGHEQQRIVDTDTVPNGDVVNKKTETKKVGKKRPWAGKLQARIGNTQMDDGQEKHIATVTQLVPTPTSMVGARFRPKTWNMNLNCLKCDHPLD